MRAGIFLVLFAVIIAVLIGLPTYFLGYFEAPGDQVVFTVQKGENFAQLAGKLQALGIVKSGRALRWYVNFSNPPSKLKRGEFGLYKNMPVPEVIHALTEGKPMEYKVTIPEGYNVFQIAEILETKGLAKKEDFIAAAKSAELVALLPTISADGKKPNSIEGYIFPDTYLLQKVFSAREIAQIMIQRFREIYHSLEGDVKNSMVAQSLNLTPHQIITLASIVEKETGAASERPMIAGLFVNRLKKRMRLQTDPTVIYGVWWRDGVWDGNIRRKDLDDQNEYNTYQISGLPPGPIASPGMNAIKAVLSPAETEYLYFVSKNDGTSIFSKEYKDHQKAVQNTQLRSGAKEGKSWKNLPSEQRAK